MKTKDKKETMEKSKTNNEQNQRKSRDEEMFLVKRENSLVYMEPDILIRVGLQAHTVRKCFM